MLFRSRGELLLLPESLVITEKERSSYTYTISDVREYPNLDRNDPAYIPKSIIKDGYPLPLQDIEWRGGYSDRYTALASYSTLASGTKVSGYTAMATYSGEVTKEAVGQSIYTIVYEGEQIIVPFNFAPFIVAGVIMAGCIVAIILLWKLRRNVEVYTYQQGVLKIYRRMRIRWQNPTLELTQLSEVQVRLVLSKKLARQLENQLLFVVGRYSNVRFEVDGGEIQEFWIEGNEADAIVHTGDEVDV